MNGNRLTTYGLILLMAALLLFGVIASYGTTHLAPDGGVSRALTSLASVGTVQQ